MSYYKQLFDIKGRVAIVTGALGILGRKFCEGLAEFGANLVILDLNLQECKAYANELEKRYGVTCLGVACDVSKPTEIENMLRLVDVHFEKIHILINNAASKSSDIRSFYNPTESYTLKQWRQITSVNIDGMFLVAREVGKRMIRQGTAGSIIQTSSIYGVVAPDPRLYQGAEYLGGQINTPVVYSVSKSAVHGLSRHLAVEWAPYGIRVNTLVPGGIAHEQNETFKQNYALRTPFNRMGNAEEMVGAVLFMASDASSYMTGQRIIVDGGFSIW